MKEFGKDELKEIVLDSYNLLVALPSPEWNSKSGKFEMRSRNKLRSLPEALREMADPAPAITHFVKNAAYFLPRAEKGSSTDKIFGKFLFGLLDRISTYSGKEKDPERVRQKIQYLIGYVNWAADSVCVLRTATNSNENEFKQRLRTMMNAEFTIIGAGADLENVLGKVIKWSIEVPAEQKSRQGARD